MTIIEQALIEARNWPQHLKLAVNVSPVQLRDRTLAEQILKLLAQTGFPAKRLEIEITENALIEDSEQVLATIHSLKNVGISISLDDFGTGYASLAQVNSLPFDRIKIDKSFISTIVKSEQTAAIVNTIASLGHTLSVPITAEGVESEQMRGELKKIGCSEAQGWLFGRAVSAETVRTFLSMKSADASDEFGAGDAGRAAIAGPPLVTALASGEHRGAADSEDRLAVDIARRRIAADQIIPVRLIQSAADVRRRRPDHLRIMGNVLPIAARADRREHAGADVSLFRRPHADELLRAERAVIGHGEVLALAGTRLARRMNELPEASERRPVARGRRG